MSAVLIPTAAVFAMTSTNYGIGWDSINSGGSDTSTSETYQLRDTIGEAATGVSTSTNYQLSAGYRVGDASEASLTLVIGTQENVTKQAWTAFSNGSKTVTVASASGYATDTYIGVVENEGAAQLVAVGKITAIAGQLITVDSWSGEPGSLSASPAGNNDFTYRLNGSNADLSARALNTVGTSLTFVDVLSTYENGYTVTVQASSTLQQASGLAIADVSDGSVTSGSEEYGGEAVGTNVISAGDFAFPVTSTRNVQKSITYADHERAAILYKISINSGTPTGNFGQVLYYRLTPNF
jgi:hypothetical protein